MMMMMIIVLMVIVMSLPKMMMMMIMVLMVIVMSLPMMMMMKMTIRLMDVRDVDRLNIEYIGLEPQIDRSMIDFKKLHLFLFCLPKLILVSAHKLCSNDFHTVHVLFQSSCFSFVR